MKSLVPNLKKSLIIFVALVQVFGLSVFGFGGAAFAEDLPPAESVVVCPQVSGTIAPTGASAYTFVYNPATCLWENSYYTWDPVTKVYAPKYDQTPILNSAGTAWEYTEWNFNSALGAYVASIVSIPVPQPAVTITNPDNPDSSSTQTPSVLGLSGAQSNLVGGSTISNTGPNSTNGTTNSGSFSGDLSYLNNTQLFTNLTSSASSGSAFVMQNTNGGSALTGDAEVIANFLNMIQSSWDPTQGDITMFNAGLFGDFYGDILFNPDAILNTGPSSNNTISSDTNNDLNISSVDNASIQNEISLSAVSGDATVSQNTNAGDATTGDATAIANIINMINSSLVSGDSFIGSLNIYGDFVGDLLLPDSILSELKNTGTNSTNTIANSQDTDIDLTVEKNNSITNNLDLAATSGVALVDSNTNAGDATSGDASTSVQQLNVIGQNSTSTKGLLVFVNVLGVWQGMIWDGTGYSSILGSGPDSNNLINNSGTTDIDANFVQNYSIQNNINLNAVSGDATVSQNTNGGNARTGDASSAVNLLNMIDSNLTFSDWFGVLFINVFGSWEGSFGVNTNAGNPSQPPLSYNAPTSNPVVVNNSVTSNTTNSGADQQLATARGINNIGGSGADQQIIAQTASAVQAGSINTGEVKGAITTASNVNSNQTLFDSWVFALTFFIVLGLLFRTRIVELFKNIFGSSVN